MLQHLIHRAIESWVERGRNRDLLKEDGAYVLRYGTRFRIQHIVNSCIFVFFFIFGLITSHLGILENPRLEMFYLLFFGGLAVLASIYLTYVLTSRVEISDESVSVRCFGLTISTCARDQLVSAYKSPVHESVVLRRVDGKKTRISTHFDGLTALVAWLSMRPRSALTDSIRDWMAREAPDLAETSDGCEGERICQKPLGD
jgi:hypothetical protein